MFRRLPVKAALLILLAAASCQPVAPATTAATSSPILVSPTGAGESVPSSGAASGQTPTLALTSAPTAASGAPDPAGLAISAMRAKAYPGSDIVIEKTLGSASNYNRYIASYQSDGLTLFGLLTVPKGDPRAGGWPVILLNHGYIPPAEYSTDQSYSGIVAPLAAAGYIVFKPDYRGNGNSPGVPYQPYVSPAYVTDSMNALASIKRYPGANPDRIGVWAHSMGGNITLRELVITHDFKAAVLMAGVVGPYSGILDWWTARVANGVLTTQNDLQTDQLVLQMVSDHGTPQTNPAFWNAIDPTAFTSDIGTPVQIQVGTADSVVPPSFSAVLAAQLQSAGKSVTLHTYPGADHNLSPYTAAAVVEAIAFFNQYLK